MQGAGRARPGSPGWQAPPRCAVVLLRSVGCLPGFPMPSPCAALPWHHLTPSAPPPGRPAAPGLDWLDLSRNALAALPPALAAATALRTLELQGNPLVLSAADAALLAGLLRLERVQLELERYSDEATELLCQEKPGLLVWEAPERRRRPESQGRLPRRAARAAALAMRSCGEGMCRQLLHPTARAPFLCFCMLCHLPRAAMFCALHPSRSRFCVPPACLRCRPSPCTAELPSVAKPKQELHTAAAARLAAWNESEITAASGRRQRQGG